MRRMVHFASTTAAIASGHGPGFDYMLGLRDNGWAPTYHGVSDYHSPAVTIMLRERGIAGALSVSEHASFEGEQHNSLRPQCGKRALKIGCCHTRTQHLAWWGI